MRLRAQGWSLAISVNRLVSGVVSMTFLEPGHFLCLRGGGHDVLLCVLAGDKGQELGV